MKIAILHSGFYEFGGAERVIVNLAKSLKDRGYKVEVFASGFSNKAARSILNSHNIPFHSMPITMVLDLRHNYKIAGWLIKDRFKDFDVINVHNHPAYVWLHYARSYTKHRFPELVIWTCHEPPKDLYPELLLNNLMRLPLYKKKRNKEAPEHKIQARIREDIQAVKTLGPIFCNSSYIQNTIKIIYGRDAIPCHFGIDLSRMGNVVPAPLPKNPTIVTLCRLELAKNLDSILKALALTVKKEPELADTIKLKVGGTGSQLNRLKRMARELGLGSIVDFSGFIKEKDIPSFYQQGSFGIFMPLDEAMGLIPMELGCYARATIGSNQGGIPEIIQDNTTGLLADPMNIEEISDKILRLCKNRQLAERLGLNAREHVLHHFSFERSVDLFEEKLLANRPNKTTKKSTL